VTTVAELIFEDVAQGDELTPLVRHVGTPHLVRWCAASENWHRIHYDAPFCIEHEKLPGPLVNGSWKQHFLVQMMREWLGPTGWLGQISFQFRAMNVAGETLTAHGTVKETCERGGFGVVVCEIGIHNEQEAESTPGKAKGVLPLRGGPAVPHSFPVDLLDD
jgi:acyl dehydratase